MQASPVGAIGPQAGEERLEELSGFLGKYARPDLEAVIEPLVATQVVERAQSACLGVGGGVDAARMRADLAVALGSGVAYTQRAMRA